MRTQFREEGVAASSASHASRITSDASNNHGSRIPEGVRGLSDTHHDPSSIVNRQSSLTPISVIIVSPYASVRAGLRALLAEFDEIEVLAAVSGTAELDIAMAERRPDVVLLDWSDTEGGLITARAAEAEAALVVLGDDPSGFRDLLDRPIRGWAYLLKEADGHEIAGAVRAAHAGLVVLDRSLTSVLANAGPRAFVRGI